MRFTALSLVGAACLVASVFAAPVTPSTGNTVDAQSPSGARGTPVDITLNGNRVGLQAVERTLGEPPLVQPNLASPAALSGSNIKGTVGQATGLVGGQNSTPAPASQASQVNPSSQPEVTVEALENNAEVALNKRAPPSAPGAGAGSLGSVASSIPALSGDPASVVTSAPGALSGGTPGGPLPDVGKVSKTAIGLVSGMQPQAPAPAAGSD